MPPKKIALPNAVLINLRNTSGISEGELPEVEGESKLTYQIDYLDADLSLTVNVSTEEVENLPDNVWVEVYFGKYPEATLRKRLLLRNNNLSTEFYTIEMSLIQPLPFDSGQESSLRVMIYQWNPPKS